MIDFDPYFYQDASAIVFDEKDLPKLITVFERALNTLSPPDQELLKVLSDMKLTEQAGVKK